MVFKVIHFIVNKLTQILDYYNERYRSFDSLTNELTSIIGKNVTLPNGVRNIYSMDGKKVRLIFFI